MFHAIKPTAARIPFQDYHTAPQRPRGFAGHVDDLIQRLADRNSYHADELARRIQALPRTRAEVIGLGVGALEGYAQAVTSGNPLNMRAHIDRLEAATAVLCGDYGPTFDGLSAHGLHVLLKAWCTAHRTGPTWMLPCTVQEPIGGVPCRVDCHPDTFGPRSVEWLELNALGVHDGAQFVSTTGFLRVDMPVTPGQAFLPALRERLQQVLDANPLVPIDTRFRRFLGLDGERTVPPAPAPAHTASPVPGTTPPAPASGDMFA